MAIKLKPLYQQVLFITGATSGIGLATLHQAVEQGAKVFMVARNEEELQRIQDDMRRKGYDTAYAVADVAELDQIQFAADQCVKTFGGIDTFINNAGISLYGKVLETTDDEAKRLFDTNFWGVVNGCKVAVPFLKEKGGVLINLGSVLSHVAIPIQGVYSASKYAVKGYTDSLRREIMAEKIPIQVTLITPSAIDTPYPEHARSLIGDPTHVPPVYAVDVVAKAILKCAVKPTRELGIGSPSIILPWMDKLLPNLQDKIMARKYREKNQSPGESSKAGSLFVAPKKEGEEAGHFSGHVMKSSIATQLSERKGWLKGGAIISGFAYLLIRRFRHL